MRRSKRVARRLGQRAGLGLRPARAASRALLLGPACSASSRAFARERRLLRGLRAASGTRPRPRRAPPRRARVGSRRPPRARAGAPRAPRAPAASARRDSSAAATASFARAMVALAGRSFGRLRQQAQRQLAHARRHGAARHERRHRLVQDAIARDVRVVRRVARDQLVEQRAEGIEVVGGLRRLAAQLLRARVVGRIRRVRRCRRARSGRSRRAARGPSPSRKTLAHLRSRCTRPRACSASSAAATSSTARDQLSNERPRNCPRSPPSRYSMTRKVRPSTLLEAVDRDREPGRQRRRVRDLGFEPRAGARRRRSTDSSKNLSATSLAALAVSREPDLRAAAAADPSHQHKPGAEFEPGCQLLHVGSTRAARLRGRRLRVRGGRAGGAVGTSPVSSL